MNRIKQVLWERRRDWFQAQTILRKEQKAAELRATGLPEEEIAARIEEMFPIPVEELGRTRLALRKSHRKVRRARIRQNRRAPTSWTVV